MVQIVFSAENGYEQLGDYILKNNMRKPLVVCGLSFKSLAVGTYIADFAESGRISVSYFSDFQPNPTYESVVKGVEFFKANDCDSIVAIGGGSAIDVAKCVKLFAFMKGDGRNGSFLTQKIEANDIPFVAIPTTSGTGSEATRFAVIYYDGEKQSVTDNSCIPSAVLLDASAISSVSEYQRKSTMLDALCHAVESFWSVNSTDESKDFSCSAIKLITANMDSYLKNEVDGNKNMLIAANIAGKAINITQTTAGHAMCYKLTSLYNIAHGHAAALCVSELWPYMIDHTERCMDKRGHGYVAQVFAELAEAMDAESPQEAAMKFKEIVLSLNLKKIVGKDGDFEILKKSVNPTRLKNNPVLLDETAIDILYHKILSKEN